MRIIPYTAFAIALVTAFATQVHASPHDVQVASQAKISLVKAIEAAEAHQHGTAIDASIDDDSFSPTYEVSVVKDERLFDVRVDAVNGSVVGVREDKDD